MAKLIVSILICSFFLMPYGAGAKTLQGNAGFDYTGAISGIKATGSIEEIGISSGQSYLIRVLLKHGKEELTLQQTVDFDKDGRFGGASGTSYKVTKGTFAAIKYDRNVERNGTIVPAFVLVFSTRKAFDDFIGSQQGLTAASVIEHATTSNGFERIDITPQ